MAQKGHNSILFDFWSIVDKELSVINFLTSSGDIIDQDISDAFYSFKYYTMNSFSGRSLLKDLEWRRMFGVRDLFEEALEYVMKKTNRTTAGKTTSEFLNAIWSMYEEEILFGNECGNPILTKSINLLNAYHHAGNGVISTTVHCTSSHQEKFIRRLDKKTNIIIGKYNELDLSRYGRLIIGEVEDAVKYEPKEPKSILVLNFRENFEEENIEIPKKELIVAFGDIHNIEIMEAYTNLNLRGEE